MSDIKLFSLMNDAAVELAGKFAVLEKELQILIERNMESFLGVRFIKSEHTTGKTHGGRIDSLGIDEDGCPVIIEYKRHSKENVINQGLFYLDWLLDHQAEFQLLVMDKLNAEVAQKIEWSGTRLICIASDFNKFDEHAVQQIDRNIELMRYRYFGDDLLLLELVNARTASSSYAKTISIAAHVESGETAGTDNTSPRKRNDLHENRKEAASDELLQLYEMICDFAQSLGDEVQRKELKFYTAFKRIRNFLSVQVWAPVQDPTILLYLNLNPKNIELKEGFSSDVTNKGHWGTGNLEVRIKNVADVEKAKNLIEMSYLDL